MSTKLLLSLFIDIHSRFVTYRPQTSPSTRRDSRGPERTRPRVDDEAIEGPRRVWHWRFSSTTCTTATPGPEEGERQMWASGDSRWGHGCSFSRRFKLSEQFQLSGAKGSPLDKSGSSDALRVPSDVKKRGQKRTRYNRKRERRDSARISDYS